jgi:pimeloyl-ACP methyl ester carboxylesterase
MANEKFSYFHIFIFLHFKMKLFYRELGQGEPLVILHGVFGSSDNWVTVSKLLSEDYKVYLVDARNHGQSPKSDQFDYDVMSEDLKEFLTAHSIQDSIIIGHSMGGKIAMKFASKYPEMLKKLIVADISPRFYKRHHDTILEGLKSIDLDQLSSRQQADEQLAKFVPEPGVRQFLLKNLYRNSENRFDWRINLGVIDRNIENIGEALSDTIRITIPTLFVKGSLSNYIGKQDEELIHKMFPNSKIETVEGAGHWVQAEKPQEFIEIIRRFLV